MDVTAGYTERFDSVPVIKRYKWLHTPKKICLEPYWHIHSQTSIVAMI